MPGRVKIMKKKAFLICLGLFFFLGTSACQKEEVIPSGREGDYPIKPVPFTSVRIADEFWLPRIETNRTITIPFAIDKNEDTKRVDNFAIAAGRKEGKYTGRRFNDTDVYKVIEGIAYSLQVHPDPNLEKYTDGLIDLIAASQEEDGYLYPARTADPENPAPGAGPERWSRLRGSHELYNAGHMYEAAVAYYLATGKRAFLNAAIKNADMLVRTFGPDRRRDVPGHQEIEIGLAKLYRITGKKEYLDLAKFFLDERGLPHDGGLYSEDSPFALYNGREYMQDHIPVTEQEEAVGHAVRATYMYAGMADVAALTGNADYIQAIDRLWENVVSKKLYLTGGVGARHTSEAFGDDYELPNRTAYTETCAAIGNAFWNHRMFLLHGDAKYIDVLERVLYNGLISGVSLEGDCFFYQNPLESTGGYERSPWFEVACCPGNIVRFIPSFPGYIYAEGDGGLYINLFVQSQAEIGLNGQKVRIRQETRYPWEGEVKITVDPEKEKEFTVSIRIPGWAQGRPVPSDLYRFLDERTDDIGIRVNGLASPFTKEKGFARIHRKWTQGDTVEILLPMPVRMVASHEKVADNLRKVALQRGPVVYCFEEVDNPGRVLDLSLPDDPSFEFKFFPDFLGGVVVVKGLTAEKHPFAAVPYFAWAHRGPGEMGVWIYRE
jgi:DUF1680 family protein